MYILLDLERLVVLHKHDDIHALSNLAWIECQSTSYSIFSIHDALGFRDLTDLELTKLYQNITTVEPPKLNRLQLMQVIFDACARIPKSDVNSKELDKQAEHIKEGDTSVWLYVKGSSKPAVKADLFLPVARKAKVSDTEIASAIDNNLPALKPHSEPLSKNATQRLRTASTARENAKGNATPQGKASTAQSKRPKQGSVTAHIRDFAEKEWEKAQKPTDASKLKSFKKEIAELLKAEGYHPSTVSTQLSKWIKTKTLL